MNEFIAIMLIGILIILLMIQIQISDIKARVRLLLDLYSRLSEEIQKDVSSE